MCVYVCAAAPEGQKKY